MTDEFEKQRKVELLELSDMMSRENGRNMLRRMLKHSGYFDEGFNPDPMINANRCGARGEGVWLYNEMKEAAPNDLIKLITEHNKNG